MTSNPNNRAVDLAQAFANACNDREAATAEQLCSPDSWASKHGDSPGRFFRKITDDRRGATVMVGQGLVSDDGQRAQVAFELLREGRAVALVVALIDLAAGKCVGITKLGAHADAWLNGTAPALLQFDELPEDGDAADAVVAMNLLAHQARSGHPMGAEMMTTLMNEAPDGGRVVAWLQQMMAGGDVAKVVEARRLPGLGRSVVKVQHGPVDPDFGPETSHLYALSGPPLAWYDRSSIFSADILCRDVEVPAS